MQSTTDDNQVAIILNSIEVLKTGPQILQANQITKDKALQVGKNIPASIDENGMDQATDERAMKFLSNVNAANKRMKEDRAGVTQIMDQLKKMYTEVENELDIKKPGTVAAQVQAHRDTYARQVAAEKEAQRRAAQLVADKAKEAINIKGNFEQRFSSHYQDFLTGRKQAMQVSFNSITYADFGERAAKLKTISPVLSVEKFEIGLVRQVSATFHTWEECTSLQNEIYLAKISDCKNNYTAEMQLLIDDLIEKLPSKLRELTEQKKLDDEAAAEQERQRLASIESDKAIASANEAEKKQLEEKAEQERTDNERRNNIIAAQQRKAAEDQAAREQADNDRIAAENEEVKRKEAIELEVKLEGEKTMVMFEQEASVADMGSTAAARQGFDIVVLHPVGYTQIFSLWFEHEGKNLPIDKLGNTKLDQMKTWCEKKALKDGTKIESKFLDYQESFKAINKKAK